MIGKLQRVPLREVWKHEALDFSKWLQNNPDVLSDAIGINLSNIERERAAGDFNVDLVGEDESGNPVIIENQLEKSNHDHLGKLLTYLAAIEAKTAIWIVSDPRPEHVKAVAWLNDSSSASFYLIKVEAVKIGESEPAPMLTLIVGPSIESKSVEHTKKELVERHINRKRFWAQLVDELKARNIALHSNILPGFENWLATSAGKRGLALNYLIRMNDAAVCLYIDRNNSEEETAKAYEYFEQHKDEIERVFGEPLFWEPLPGKRASRITARLDVGGLRDEDKWDRLQDVMIDAMSRFERALRPYVDDM
ncbi:MAG: DUF4268 domain-containing protein [Armatimonadetes bacterium]|nr:DUF4268 domain-containing protein [Armatimonadota bacterium]